MELQRKKNHAHELGNGYHEAGSTAHCLLNVSSCELGNRRRFTDNLSIFQRTRKRKESKASVKHARVEGSEVREPVKSPVFHSRFYPRAQRSNNNTRKLRTENGVRLTGSVTGTNFAVCSYEKFMPGWPG